MPDSTAEGKAVLPVHVYIERHCAYDSINNFKVISVILLLNKPLSAHPFDNIVERDLCKTKKITKKVLFHISLLEIGNA